MFNSFKKSEIIEEKKFSIIVKFANTYGTETLFPEYNTEESAKKLLEELKDTMRYNSLFEQDNLAFNGNHIIAVKLIGI